MYDDYFLDRFSDDKVRGKTVKHEFNQVLQVGAEEELQEEKKQRKLKEKFGIKGKNVVVVERTNMVKFIIRTMAAIIRLVATILLIGLAFIGILALVYEEPRKELVEILWNALEQIKQSVPFLNDIIGRLI